MATAAAALLHVRAPSEGWVSGWPAGAPERPRSPAVARLGGAADLGDLLMGAFEEQPPEPATEEEEEEQEQEVEKPSATSRWRKPLRDVTVGETFDGIVGFKNKEAVWIDVGVTWRRRRCLAHVLAPKKKALDSLQPRQRVSATVEKVEDGRFWVSVAGLPKMKLIKDFQVGETLEGRVAFKSQRGVLVDVGSDRNAFVYAPKKMALEKLRSNQIVSTTVEKVDGPEQVWVSVDGLPKMREPEDLRVGETLDGIVAFKSMKDGVYVDIGLPRTAKVLAPRLTALEMLEADAIVSATVEKVEENVTWVSVSGVPKPQRVAEDMEAGETLEGTVAYQAREGVYVDIGCERFARVFAPIRQSLDTLEVNQVVTATIEKVPNSKALWVSVAGLPKLRLLEDLREGEKLDGRVVKRTKDGVFLDVGTMTRQARVLAPRSEALTKLQMGNVVRATVEKIRPEYILVSVPGLPKLKKFEDLREGERINGYVAMRFKGGVLINIGCEQLGLLRGPMEEVFMLEPNEQLNGLKIESIDVEGAKVALSYAGLSDLVALRLARQGSPTPAGPGQRPPKRQHARTSTPPAPAAPQPPQPPVTDDGLEEMERRTVELEGELQAAKDADDFLECHRISTELKRMKAELGAAGQQTPGVAPGAPEGRQARGEPGRGAAPRPSPDSAGPPEGRAGAPEKTAAKEDPFKDFEVGQTVTGTIGNKLLKTVWADIGVGRRARVGGPKKKLELLRWGEVLTLVFKSFNRDKGTTTVNVQDLDERVAGREADRVRLEDVEVGSIVEGHVEGKEYPTVWVDFGAAKVARLYLSGRGNLWRKLQFGAGIKVKVDRVDVNRSEVDAQLAADE